MSTREPFDFQEPAGREPLIATDRPFSLGLSEDDARVLPRPLDQAHSRRSFDGRVPFKGLEAFRESDAEFFVGRDSLVQQG